jgi:hypothetical protein
LSCTGQAQGGWLWASVRWTGDALWNSEPAKIARYSTFGGMSGMAVVGSYFAYNSDLKGNLTKVLLGGLIGGGLGLVCGQLWGVKATAKRIEAIVQALQKNMATLSINVQNGFQETKTKLNEISVTLKNCATFEALAQVKRELMALMGWYAQDQKQDTQRQIDELKQQLSNVSCEQTAMRRALEHKLDLLLARPVGGGVQHVNVNVSNTSTNTNDNVNRNSNANNNTNTNTSTTTNNNVNKNNNFNKNKNVNRNGYPHKS